MPNKIIAKSINEFLTHKLRLLLSMDIEDAPSIDTMFRIQTLLYLKDRADKGVSGYDLILEIEKITGSKPSGGKLYPFLKQLSETRYLEEELDDESQRSRTLYRLTPKGIKLVDELLKRMRVMIDARVNLLLEACYHCGTTVYEAKVTEIDEDGVERKYCCIHCMNASSKDDVH